MEQFRVNFMEVVWFVVVWFLVRQVWARNGRGELFLIMLCNQKGACSLLRLGGGGKYLIVFVSFEESVFAMFVAIKNGVKNAMIFVE